LKKCNAETRMNTGETEKQAPISRDLTAIRWISPVVLMNTGSCVCRKDSENDQGTTGNFVSRSLQLSAIRDRASLLFARLGGGLGFGDRASRFFTQAARLLSRLTRNLPDFREIGLVLQLVSHVAMMA
jgi:hypothetical protein